MWATAQYLSYAMVGSVLDIDVTIAVAGHQITQARATGHVADREVFTVNAALGSRDRRTTAGAWRSCPTVPPPDELARRGAPVRRQRRHDDRRPARPAASPRAGCGRARGPPRRRHRALWIRLPELLDMSASALAILGDYVPFGIGQALGQLGGGNSLDNTLRVAQVVPTDWVLVDVRIHAIRNGFGHGLVHLWSQDGTLLATASQSTIVRHWTEERQAVARQFQTEEEGQR